MQNDFPTLIENYDSQDLTQSSTASMRQSQRSEIELKFPANDQDSSHTESEDDTPGAGRPTGSKARLEDVGPRQMRDRSAEIYNDMVQFCKANGQELDQFLSFQGKRYYLDKSSEYMNREKGKMFEQIFKGKNPFEYVDVSPRDGLYLQTSLDIGKTKYLSLRKFLLDNYDISLPNTDKVRDFKNDFVPKYNNFFTGTVAGKWLPLEQVIADLTKQFFASGMAKMPEKKFEDNDTIIVKGCGGFDASGRHQKFRNLEDASDHLILGGFRLISIHNSDGEKLYEEESRGPESEFPWFLIPCNEADVNTQNIINEMALDINRCKEKDIFDRPELSVMIDGKEVRIETDLRWTQFDRSLIEKVSGMKGAICTLCKCGREDANDPQKIKQGFEITRNNTDARLLASILFNPDGSFKPGKKNLSSDAREGMTAHPMETGELDINLNIPILHAWIHVLKHLENIGFFFLSRFAFPNNIPIQGAGQKKQEGTEKKGKTEDQKKAFTAAKKKFMERANSKDGFNRPLNFADAVGSGGNKDNGNMAKRFLSFEQRENVLDLYEPFDSLSQRDELRKIIQGFHVILRVASSTRKINTEEFHKFNLKVYYDLKVLFPWMSIQDSCHGLFHSGQFIRDYNNGYGLGQFEEGPLESAHKYIRAFRVRLARFSSTNDNLSDVIARLYCKVSPIFRSLKPKPTRMNVPKPPVLNEDDEMVNSFFLDEENL